MFSKQAIVFLHKWQVSWMKKTTHLVVMIICFMTIWCSVSCHNISNFTSCDAEGQWPNQGGGLFNTRHAYSKNINSSTISKLALKWQFNAGFDVFVTPSVSNDGIIYFPTLNGNFYALDAKSGNVLWARNLTSFISNELLIEFPTIHSEVPYILSRMTPVITKHSVLVGIYGPAVLLSLNRYTGNLIWSSLLDTHPWAVLTMSGTVHKSSYFLGISSLEEANPNLTTCCYFQGKMLKIDVKTGSIQWKTLMLPDNHGKTNLYAGAALWGSSPSIDTKRNLVFIATGNLYSAPPSVQKCEERQQNKTHRDYPDPCIKPEDHSESILALDLDNGNIVWSHHLGAYDTWVKLCEQPSIPKNPNCPAIVGPDADFGEAPMMLTIQNIETNSNTPYWQDIVVTGQKNGYVWALDRDNGELLWATVAGPGGLTGGTMWGAATDGTLVFVNSINSEHLNFTLIPSNVVTTGGGRVAIDARNGTILWSVATPDGTIAPGPLAVTNGVVFAPFFGHPYGVLFALESETGKILWQHQLNSSVAAGVSIVDDCVYLPQGISIGTSSVFPSVRGYCQWVLFDILNVVAWTMWVFGV